ncbi:hypothetical protein EYW47_07405 [Paraburkholderia silviterrae]|uniref:Uncharacterized protein n=1 Tax=Paraburkholderia silviterrae TaxID=2528715 RepID=A0A4R5MFT2_9BURK|nr:hypothetical protein EYW47_07405 [Paraburkholderia silviterrae]
MSVTFRGQKYADNSPRRDTQIHAIHIKVDFWQVYDAAMGENPNTEQARKPHGARPGARGTCCRHYLSYRSRAYAAIVLKMRARRSLRSADGYVATADVEPRSAARIFGFNGSGYRRNLAMTPGKDKENCEWAS